MGDTAWGHFQLPEELVTDFRFSSEKKASKNGNAQMDQKGFV